MTARPKVDFQPMCDRVTVIVEPHRVQTFYELDLPSAEWLLADLRRAVETARKWAEGAG